MCRYEDQIWQDDFQEEVVGAFGDDAKRACCESALNTHTTTITQLIPTQESQSQPRSSHRQSLTICHRQPNAQDLLVVMSAMAELILSDMLMGIPLTCSTTTVQLCDTDSQYYWVVMQIPHSQYYWVALCIPPTCSTTTVQLCDTLTVLLGSNVYTTDSQYYWVALCIPQTCSTTEQLCVYQTCSATGQLCVYHRLVVLLGSCVYHRLVVLLGSSLLIYTTDSRYYWAALC